MPTIAAPIAAPYANETSPGSRGRGELDRELPVERVEGVRAQHDGDDDADGDGDRERAREAARAHDPEPGEHRDGDQQLRPEEDAPAERAEQPLPEEQHQADQQQEDEEDDAAAASAAEGERPQGLALDLVGLGLREVDVGARRRGPPRHGSPRAGPCRPGGGLGGRAARCRVRAVRDPAVVLRGGGQSFGRPRPIIAAPGGVTVEYARAMADATAFQSPADAGRAPIVTAELLAVGTELTVGETTDTNSGELARVAGRARRDRSCRDLEPARRPRRGRGRAARPHSAARTSSSPRAASVRRRTT